MIIYNFFYFQGNVAAMYRTADNNSDGNTSRTGNTPTTSTQSTYSEPFRVGGLRLPNRPRRPPARNDRSSSDRSSRRRDDEGNVDYQLD